jgi:hypothetical protein
VAVIGPHVRVGSGYFYFFFFLHFFAALAA